MKKYYTKDRTEQIICDFIESVAIYFKPLIKFFTFKKLICMVVFFILFVAVAVTKTSFKNATASESDGFNFMSIPVAIASSQRTTITVPAGTVKANPFLPYREINSASYDVPTTLLPEPPVDVDEHSDGARVMDTIVSGILYDSFSPSAILNIEGNDYLVKKGDVVNNYKVLNITRDNVTVKLGNNTYKAGIGEILTEGDVNINSVSNLNNKFGGRR